MEKHGAVARFLQNPWVRTTGSGLLVAALVSLFAQSRAIAWSLIQWLLELIVFAFLFRVPIWVVLVLVGVVILIGWVVAKLSRHEFVEPIWLQYQKDSYKDWFFEWEWTRGEDGRYQIENLTPICERCNTSLSGAKVWTNFDYPDEYLYCPECDRKYPLFSYNTHEDAKRVFGGRAKNRTLRSDDVS